MSWQDTYQYWIEYDQLDESFKRQLQEMTSDELEDCFYKYIDFGTGGMRGILGPGTNRLNRYIIRRANWGYAEYLLSEVDMAVKRGVVIAYDNRHFSHEFAVESANILAMKGIKVYLFESLRPTPELSFAVRELKAAGGMVITASHNPPQYNGYKLYNDTGCQLIPKETNLVSKYINNAPKEFDIKVNDNDYNSSIIKIIGDEIDKKYLTTLQKLSLNPSLNKKSFKIVFSPQHGTSFRGIKNLLEAEGYDLILVEEQCTYDPDFSNTKSPNPEDEDAYELALQYAIKHDADMIITTDPDADRLGVAVKDSRKQYTLITGNQLGAILLQYIVSQKRDKKILPKNPYAVTTTVTSDLGAAICQKYNIKLDLVHTGFKYIGDRIRWYERNKPEMSFIFGYEESYGYLASDMVRDKDALQAGLIAVEAACYYKQKNNKTLVDILQDIYREHGYYLDKLYNFTMTGKDGQSKITEIMKGFRENPPKELGGIPVLKIEDFLKGIHNLIPANVLKIKLKDGRCVALRPSGTEPKFKMYCCIKGGNQQNSKDKLMSIYNEVNEKYINKL